MLLLACLPKSSPCRNKEIEEIAAFIKGAISDGQSDGQCLGRCLYIHGVPGTGKTMSVLAVMRNLKIEVDAGNIKPYCFIEINGLKLASPENIYRVIYEALTGHRVSWKKALHLLNEQFSNGTKWEVENNQPCVLLVDKLDLLVTRNQSVIGRRFKISYISISILQNLENFFTHNHLVFVSWLVNRRFCTTFLTGQPSHIPN